MKFQDPAPACRTRQEELWQSTSHLPDTVVQSTSQAAPPWQVREQALAARQFTWQVVLARQLALQVSLAPAQSKLHEHSLREQVRGEEDVVHFSWQQFPAQVEQGPLQEEDVSRMSPRPS